MLRQLDSETVSRASREVRKREKGLGSSKMTFDRSKTKTTVAVSGFQMQRCWAHNQIDSGMQRLKR